MKTKPASTQSASHPTRRDFIKMTGQAAAASALAGVAPPRVHAAEDNTVRLALIGRGGRGSGAVTDAMSITSLPVKLTAMADLFDNRLQRSYKALKDKFTDRMDAPEDRQFPGFDACKKAIDCLRPGSDDIAMLTGYAGLRPAQLEYAVEKCVNVFMEKSFAAGPPGCRRVIAAGGAAEKKNLKIAAGLMCRHSRNRQELIKRIRDGQQRAAHQSRRARPLSRAGLGTVDGNLISR